MSLSEPECALESLSEPEKEPEPELDNCFKFSELFSKIFPSGNAASFCDHIFRIFDSDGNNFLDFKEYLMALDIAQCTDERQKLEWSFR